MIKMATVNTIEKVTQENGIFYDKVLLKRLVGSLQFAKYGQKRNISKNNGTEIDMRRFNSLGQDRFYSSSNPERSFYARIYRVPYQVF